MTTTKKRLLSLALGCVLFLYIVNLNKISDVVVDGQGELQEDTTVVPALLLRAASNNDNFNNSNSISSRIGRYNRDVIPYIPPEHLPDVDPKNWIYLIIHYHKTGHDLSRSLREFFNNSTAPVKSDGEENVFARRHHDQHTKCPKDVDMRRGMIYVQVSPNFFCDIQTLVQELLSHKKKTKIKIIHLVRNPFSMAISNFHYHSAFPIIENWPTYTNPCADEKYFGVQSFPELILPTFNRKFDRVLGNHNGPLIHPNDFQALSERCHELYQNSFNRPGSEKWNYYNHLRHLDPVQGLELATIHMCAAGTSGGDIVRMANNIIKLHDIQAKMANEDCGTGVPCGERIQMLTLSLDWFIQDPYGMTIRFLDFALGNAITKGEKIRIAQRYRQSYYRKVSGGDAHITNGKNVETARGASTDPFFLESKLRENVLLGRLLGNVEKIVDDALGYPPIVSN